jgi:hypothetical protein
MSNDKTPNDKPAPNRDRPAGDQTMPRDRQEARDVNLELEQAFEDEGDQTLPGTASQPGSLRGSPD